MRWLRTIFISLAGFLLSMGLAFALVHLFLLENKPFRGPGPAALERAERLAVLTNDISNLGSTLVRRLPRAGEPASPETRQWLAREFTPRAKYLRMRLHDPVETRGIPDTDLEPLIYAVETCIALAERPDEPPKRQAVPEGIEAAFRKTASAIEAAGATRYLKNPLNHPVFEVTP